jgi:hypothetical protein
MAKVSQETIAANQVVVRKIQRANLDNLLAYDGRVSIFQFQNMRMVLTNNTEGMFAEVSDDNIGTLRLEFNDRTKVSFLNLISALNDYVNDIAVPKP